MNNLDHCLILSFSATNEYNIQYINERSNTYLLTQIYTIKFWHNLVPCKAQKMANPHTIRTCRLHNGIYDHL